MNITKFGIKNFKCFNNNIKIEIKPITINIGPNNSGKSSVLKSLLLFRSCLIHSKNNFHFTENSILNEINAFVIPNFGNPQTFLNSVENDLEYELFPESNQLPDQFKNVDLSVTIHYKFGNNQYSSSSDWREKDILNRSILTYRLPVPVGTLSKYTIKIDGLPFIEISRIDDPNYIGHLGYRGNITISNLGHLPKELMLHFSNISEGSIKLEFNLENFSNSKQLIEYLKTMFNLKDSPEWQEVINLISKCLSEIICFQDHLLNIQSIELNRREYKRYVERNNQSLFANFLELYYDRTGLNMSAMKNDLVLMLNLFNLPSEFKIEQNSDYGFQFMLKANNGEYRNIADYGSGINQLLPLMFASSGNIALSNKYYLNAMMGVESENHLILIEEPESNLHPDFQSKLADMFNFLHSKRELDFIIETHSEYMIRKFQYLVATKKLNKNDIIINYFWDEEDIKFCKQINFEDDGSLSDSFGKGFFDTADQIALDLFLLKYHQNN